LRDSKIKEHLAEQAQTRSPVHLPLGIWKKELGSQVIWNTDTKRQAFNKYDVAPKLLTEKQSLEMVRPWYEI
jgi:hypothetical protein